MKDDNNRILSLKNKEESPLVSICCITYNHEKYIADAIESFLMQETNFPIEIIIHDDASTDRTADIIRIYEEKHPDIIKAIYQTENQHSKGVKRIMARFTFTQVSGKYIALCEGDDFWTDIHKLKKQIDYLETNPECTLCTHATETIVFNEDKRNFDPPFSQDTKFYIEDALQIKPNASVNGIGHTSSMVFPKKVIEEIPQWYFNFSTGDVPLKILCTIKGYGYYIHEYMSSYRKGIAGSWNERVRANDSKFKETLMRNILCFDSINEYTNFKYNDIISIRIENDRRAVKQLDDIIIKGDKWVRFILKYIEIKQLNNIAIFGIERAGLKIMDGLLDNNIKPRVILDNYRYGREIKTIPIHHPKILKSESNIDLVIITILGKHYLEIEKQISLYNSNIELISIKNI